jgi:CHASE2 domain-containing sensor protein
MNVKTINFINALVLIGAGIYGYFVIPPVDAAKGQSITALIPAFAGLLLLILGLLWNKNPKVVAHVAVVIVLLLFIVCIRKFLAGTGWDDKRTVFLVCTIATGLSLLAFVNSFIQARVKK